MKHKIYRDESNTKYKWVVYQGSELINQFKSLEEAQRVYPQIVAEKTKDLSEALRQINQLIQLSEAQDDFVMANCLRNVVKILY